jgi:hypothetical protein
MRTKAGRDVIRKEYRREQGLGKSRRGLLTNDKIQDGIIYYRLRKILSNSFKLWTQQQPKMSTVNAKMVSLLKETEDLVNLLDEPVYIVEMKDSGDIKLCRRSELKKVM